MAYTKEEYEFFKSKGICVKCRKEKAAPNRIQCWDCLHLDKERKLKNKTKLSSKRKEYNKRKKHLCIAFGVCRECQNRDAKKGQVCLECWLKIQKRKKSTEIARNERHEYGLCYICGKPASNGHKLCETHLDITRKNMSYAKSLNNYNFNHHQY